MITDSNKSSTPAYKEPWFWFLMAPLFGVFIMGFTMLYLSISTNDGVIVDNFYKDGLAINAREEQDSYARELHLTAQLRLDQTLANIQVKGELTELPDSIWLHIIYPTKESRDIKVPLQRSGDIFTGALPEVISGRYQVMISPRHKSNAMWRLHAESTFPLQEPLVLSPK